jgi:signal transduction histidine kinase
LKLSQKALVLVAVPLLFELTFIAALAFLLHRADEGKAREVHARSILSHVNNITGLTLDAVKAMAAYRISREETLMYSYDKSIASIDNDFAQLGVLVADNRLQSAQLKEAHAASARLMHYLDESKNAVFAGNTGEASEYLRKFKEPYAELSGDLAKLVEQYRQIGIGQGAEQELNHNLQKVLIGGVFLSIVISFALAIYFNKATTARMSILIENTNNLANKKQLHTRLAGKDEFAMLDNTFHQMAKSLEEAAQAKRDFVAMVTHDLRTPLTSLSAAIHVLLSGARGELQAGVREDLRQADGDVDRLIRLINDLLDVEKIEAGKSELKLEEVPAAYIIENACSAIASYAAEKQVSLRKPDCALTVYGDGDALVRVLMNLLSNAIKFSPAGSQVIIDVAGKDPWAEFSVTDCGPGIKPELHGTIFERYKQVSSTREKSQGTGLGLAVCKSIVEQHQGEIGIDSAEGKGSRFWFRIKLFAGQA